VEVINLILIDLTFNVNAVHDLIIPIMSFGISVFFSEIQLLY
jgi:hypothetical protein